MRPFSMSFNRYCTEALEKSISKYATKLYQKTIFSRINTSDLLRCRWPCECIQTWRNTLVAKKAGVRCAPGARYTRVPVIPRVSVMPRVPVMSRVPVIPRVSRCPLYRYAQGACHASGARNAPGACYAPGSPTI